MSNKEYFEKGRTMNKCNKCGAIITDNDSMAWKCTSCGKAFKVNLFKLKKLQMLKNKPENAEKKFLKCPTCGNGIDNGNEKIACKCSACGNVMVGTLMNFALIEKQEVEHEDVNTKVYDINVISKQNIHKQNKKNKDSRKIMVLLLIILISIIFVAAKPIQTIYYDKQYTDKLLNLLQQNVGGYEYVNSIEIKNMMKKDRSVILNMSDKFDALSREDKHRYLKDGLGEKIQDVYFDWIYENKVYNNELWIKENYPYDHIEVALNCKGKIYKYGFYQKADGYNFYDFKNEFLDIDGVSYEFVNKEEEEEYYKQLEERRAQEKPSKSYNNSSDESTIPSYSGLYDAELKYSGTDGVLICVSENAMERFMSAVNNGNDGSLQELFLDGQCAYTEQGTKCNIVDRKLTKCQVKLLDGIYAGNTVWVVIEAVQEE